MCTCGIDRENTLKRAKFGYLRRLDNIDGVDLQGISVGITERRSSASFGARILHLLEGIRVVCSDKTNTWCYCVMVSYTSYFKHDEMELIILKQYF